MPYYVLNLPTQPGGRTERQNRALLLIVDFLVSNSGGKISVVRMEGSDIVNDKYIAYLKILGNNHYYRITNTANSIYSDRLLHELIDIGEIGVLTSQYATCINPVILFITDNTTLIYFSTHYTICSAWFKGTNDKIYVWTPAVSAKVYHPDTDDPYTIDSVSFNNIDVNDNYLLAPCEMRNSINRLEVFQTSILKVMTGLIDNTIYQDSSGKIYYHTGGYLFT